jgi:hypothetical protein
MQCSANKCELFRTAVTDIVFTAVANARVACMSIDPRRIRSAVAIAVHRMRESACVRRILPLVMTRVLWDRAPFIEATAIWG